MLKNLKSLFIVEEEGAVKKTKAKAVAEDVVSNEEAIVVPQEKVSSPKVPSSGNVSSQFIDILFKAMENNNLDGFDYLEFKQSLKSLEKMPMDESTRYQSAYAMAQTLGATPEKLLQTAQHYLQVLSNEEKKFEEAMIAQKQKQIGSKESEIKKLEEIVTHKVAQIKQLTKEIEEHQVTANALKEEIGEASVKVESTKNDFIASYVALVDQIRNDVENMKKFLK